MSNFTISNWRSNSTISVVSSNSTISVVSSNRSSLFSISYNGSLTAPSGGIYLKSGNSTSYTLKVQFYAETTGNLTPAFTFLSYGKKSLLLYKSFTVANSRAFNKYSYTITLPRDSYHADFRIFGSGNGSISLSDLGYSVGSLSVNYSTPFGNYLSMDKVNMTFPKDINNSYIMYTGNGTINGNDVVSLNHDGWYHITNTDYLNVSGELHILADVVSNRNITDYSFPSISSDISYFSGLIYTINSSMHNALPTIWGMSVFVDASDINGTFSVLHEKLVNATFPILLVIDGFEIYLSKKRKNRL
ncbi:MAG: hypothetical protein ACYCPR_08980 [Thermoplasmataceae archaeon]